MRKANLGENIGFELPPFRPDSRHKPVLKHRREDRLMSNEYRHVELLTGDVRRRRASSDEAQLDARKTRQCLKHRGPSTTGMQIL